MIETEAGGFLGQFFNFGQETHMIDTFKREASEQGKNCQRRMGVVTGVKKRMKRSLN